MHGAGITHTMHMAVGTPSCCSVIEVYPEGEYTRIRGHGNMARKMGIYYERIDLPVESTTGAGSVVPVKELQKLTNSLLDKMRNKPTCLHPDAIHDPYFDNSKKNKVWSN